MPPEETQADHVGRAITDLRGGAPLIDAIPPPQEAAQPDQEPSPKPAAELPVLLSISIKSKLGLEPSDHHRSKAGTSPGEPLPTKRARTRRSRW